MQTDQNNKNQGANSKKKEQIEFDLDGKAIVAKVKEIIKEGNASRIIIKNEKNQPILEIPLTIGIVSTLLAPYLVAVGAIAGVVTKCKVVVVKR